MNLHRPRVLSRNTAASAAFLGLALSLSACSDSGNKNSLTINATIGGRSVASADAGDPLPLDPRDETALILEMRNTSGGEVTVERVRLEGEVLSLNFLTYDVRVQTLLAPGASRSLEVPLDFFDLERQASGYLRAHLRLYDASEKRVATSAFAVDIKGSTFSTMNLFAFLLLALTAASAIRNARDAKRRRLPLKRFARGLRFCVPGFGFGLLLSVGFSVLRIFPLPATGWIPLTVIPGVIGFAVGYFLMPGPVDDEGLADEDEDDLEDDELAAIARGDTPVSLVGTDD